MRERETRILEGIHRRIDELVTWRRQNTSNRDAIRRFGYPLLRDAELAVEIGCRANVQNVYGRDGTRAEHAQLQRDLAKMKAAGMVVVSTCGRLRYVMPTEEVNKSAATGRQINGTVAEVVP